MITHGGSELLEGPGNHSDVARGLLQDLRIQPKRLDAAYDVDFYTRNGLTGGTYFDRETFGVDRTLPYSLVSSFHYQGWIPLADSPLSQEEAFTWSVFRIDRMPD